MSGPACAFRPSFPQEFVEQARGFAAGRRVERRLWQRAALVLVLHHNPDVSNVEAGSQVGLHENSVRNWRRRWAGEDFSLADRPRSGRKPRFSPERPSHGSRRRLRAGP